MGNKLGQHFMKDKNILRLEAKLLEGYNSILEIGGGDGRLTKILVERFNKVYVVEKDEQFKEKLEQTGAEVIIGDFLKIEPFEVDSIIGNVPYYISSKIIFRLLEWDFKKAALMLQKEFVESMVAKPNEKKYTRLSVMSQLLFDIKKIKIVKAHLFNPKPKVDSIIITLTKKNVTITKKQQELIRKLFSHKNKKLTKVAKIYKLDLTGIDEKEQRIRALDPKTIYNITKTIENNEIKNPLRK